jgi:hypothetical protein
MSPFFFNDLSIGNWITDAGALKEKLRELCAFQASVRSYGLPVYLHKNGLYASRACGLPFRAAVNAHCDKEQKRLVFGMIDKNSPSLPEDPAIPEGCRFLYEGEKIPLTGLAECAYRNFMEEGGCTYSISGSGFSRTPLPVTLETECERRRLDISNFHSPASLAASLAGQTPPPATWDDFLALAGKLEYLRFEPSVSAALKREPFSSPIAEAVHRRLTALNDMAGSESEEAFLELDNKYCRGDKAWFSDESVTRGRDLHDKLTFKVQGRPTLCTFHGKVSTRVFRIHMDARPKRGQKITVVYIGRKIL